MKKIVFSTILFCLPAVFCFGQKSSKPTPPVKANNQKPAAAVKPKQAPNKTGGAKSVQAKTDKTKPTQVKNAKSTQSSEKTSILKPAGVKADKPKQPTVKTSGAKQSKPKLPTATKTLNPPAVKPKSFQNRPASEIADADWKSLAASLMAEDWNKSASLSARFISRLKIDNEKKQLAQLRYIYLYALAGKILTPAARKSPGGEKAAGDELRAVAATFEGEEFVLPPRRFLSDCRNVFNYICPVKGNDRALRTTATGKNGTEIHSFDYVLFEQKVAVEKFAENKAFLGGTLRKIEFNDDTAKPWAMRLIFDKGFVKIVGE